MRRRLPLALGLVIAGLVQAGPAPMLQLFPYAPSATSRPNSRCDQPMCVALLRAIDGASTSIDFAIYGLRGQDEVLAALVRAQARGVMVKGVVDADIQGRNYYADTPRLLKALANVRTDQATERRSLAAQRPSSTRPRCVRPADREGPLSCFSATVGGVKYELAQASEDSIEFEGDIMHHKFFVIDRQAVWTGSANVSDSDVGGYNANVAVLITQPDVAAAYRQEFEQMYQGRFHREKTASVARKIVLPGGGTAQVLFSPQDGAMKEVVRTLKAARRSINVSVFYATNKDVATALLEARQRGVKVRVILDATAAQNEYTKHELLRSAGAQVKVEHWGGKMHAKAASVDGQHLILGSMNWTAAGDLRNDENTLILRDVPLHVRTYDAAFDVMWRSVHDLWLKANPRPEGTESGWACQDGIDNDYDGQADSKDADCRKQVAPAGRAAPRGLDCPPGFPVKGNAGSRIFHVPGGGFPARGLLPQPGRRPAGRVPAQRPVRSRTRPPVCPGRHALLNDTGQHAQSSDMTTTAPPHCPRPTPVWGRFLATSLNIPPVPGPGRVRVGRPAWPSPQTSSSLSFKPTARVTSTRPSPTSPGSASPPSSATARSSG